MGSLWVVYMELLMFSCLFSIVGGIFRSLDFFIYTIHTDV